MASKADESQMISEKVAPVLVARTLGPFDLVVIFVAIVLFINNAAGRAVRRAVGVHLLDRRLRDVPDHRGVRHGSAGPHVPGGGFALRLDPQGAGPVLGVLRRLRGVVARPDLLVFIGHPRSRTSSSSSPCSSTDCEFPCIFTENWQIGVVVLFVIWFSALMSYLRMRVTQNYVNVLFLFYAAAIFLIGFAGVVVAAEGQRVVDRLRDRVEPVPGRQARARSPREPHVLLVRDPRAPRDRDAAEHGRRGNGRREGDPDVPALGLHHRDGRLPLGDLGEHGRDPGRRGERHHRRRREPSGSRSGDGLGSSSRWSWRGSS